MSLRNGYDAFISHNHADKAWVRDLHARLATVDYNGRALRPWLDERFLDPGELSGTPELTSALDRARAFVIVLSPASIASGWVKFELDYFLASRTLDELIPLLLVPCEIPDVLRTAHPIDFTSPAAFETGVAELVRRLCPAGARSVAGVESEIDTVWDAAQAHDPGGLAPDPTPERDALVYALLRFDIDDSSSEGLALIGFQRAATRLLDDNARAHPATYNLQMLLGECLALAIIRSPRYRQVVQRYLALEDPATPDPILSAVIVRAYSKLAEIAPTLIDTGALLRVAAQLDVAAPLNGKKASLAMLLGRVAAKQRGTDRGDLTLEALSTGGAAARIAAIGGISMGEKRAPSIAYASALAVLEAGTAERSGALQPPSRKLQAMLFGIDLDQPDLVRRQLDNAKTDLAREFGIDDLPYGYSWFKLRREPAPDHLPLGPLLGTVVKATIANMEDLASRVDATHVACLTEARVVDALFDRAGALVIATQEQDSPLCRRLTSRGVPFAMLAGDRIAAVNDGDHLAIEPGRVLRVTA